MTIKFVLDDGRTFTNLAAAQQAERETLLREGAIAWISGELSRDWAGVKLSPACNRPIARSLVEQIFAQPSCPFTLTFKEPE